MADRQALIVGAGIGGLTAALCLMQNGWHVRVFEKAKALQEIGAGVQISPNGSAILQKLGVLGRLSQVMVEPSFVTLRSRGKVVFRTPIKEMSADRWGAPYVHLHRADLQNALYEAVLQLDPQAVELGAAVAGYDPVGTTLELADGSKRKADLIVGADGLRSRLRAQMHPGTAPRFTGNIALRAVVDAKTLGQGAPPEGATIWAGSKRHAVTTWLRAKTLVNFVGIYETTQELPEKWNITASKNDALDHFSAPHLRPIVEAADHLNAWGLYDHAPLPHWSQGAVVLMGDAAHPMVPSMAQGAVQAIEDAYVLAQCLEDHAPPEACKWFHQRRAARVARVQRVSASNLGIFHQTGLRRALGYTGLGVASRFVPELIHRRYDWIYGGGPL